MAPSPAGQFGRDLVNQRCYLSDAKLTAIGEAARGSRCHGTAAVEVLDHRLTGGESKELIGQPGLEASYRLKQTVQAIKQAAEEFAQDEPELPNMIRRAMASEGEKVLREDCVTPGAK